MIHLALVAAVASSAPPPIDTQAILREEKLAFCTDPSTPLGPRQKMTCSMARELDECKPLVEACNADLPSENTDWLRRLIEFLAPVAYVLLYLMIAVIVVAVAIPVIGGLMQLRRRSRKKAETKDAPNVAQVVLDAPPPDEAEPEASLEQAEALLARGEYRGALSFSLVASLGALGRRGAIRLRKDRTNGEYLRSCTDETARPPLRELVRTVDAVEFGGAEATSESAARATARAREIVRAAVIVGTLGLLLLGCDPPKRGSDPAGDELPIAVLARNGFTIKPLGSSLATMPVPKASSDHEDSPLPIIVIDTEKVPLEDETQAHLLRWVEAGGTLVLFGRPSSWPAEVRAKDDFPNTRDLTVFRDDETRFEARVGRRDAFVWKQDHEALAKLGSTTYAAKRPFGRGFILGVANDDLWTNVGVMPKHNAAALLTIMRAVDARDLRVAKAEDGIPPPSNPFAALIAAGLGKGAWHALAAAILLFLCYGIRHARPRSAPTVKRRAFVEHIEATGAFYSRSPSRSHALAVYGRFVELRLRELAPRGTDPATFLASRTGTNSDHITKLLARASEAKTDEAPKGDELDVIEELRSLLAKAASSSLTRDGASPQTP